nr:polysaccharide biosynthesis tyrosine autokinase [uncultured Draconibacterium sp.]
MTANNSNQPYNTIEQDDEIDIKRMLFLLLRKWYWLALGLFLGVTGAYLFVKYTPDKFQVNTSLLVTDDSKGFNLENLFMDEMMGSSSKVSLQNELEFLRSYTLNHQAVDNLNWQTSWQKKNLIIWSGIYLYEPFILNKSGEALNPAGIAVYITPLSETEYKITVDGEIKVEKQNVKIEFAEIANYGQPFQNEYFNFTLTPKENYKELVGECFRFSFIDKSKLTIAYLKRVNTDYSKESEVIKLSIESTEPLRDIHYLNELVRVYLELKLNLQTQSPKRSLDFIDSQLSGISSDLTAAENTFTEFRSKNQIIDLSSQGSLIMEQLKEIEQEKSQMQMQLDYFKNLQHYLGNIQSANQLVAPSVVGITDATLNALVLKLSELYSRRKILAFSAYENNPSLILLNQEIEQVTHQVREMLVNLVDNTQLSVNTLDLRYNRINKQLNNMPEQEQQLINIQRQYELTNDIYTFLLQRRAELEISLASALVDIQVIDPAQLERLVPLNKNPLLTLIIGAFLGLTLPGMLILIVDFFDNSIQLQEDIEKLTPLSILGNVLHCTDKSELVVVNQPRAPITESYRTIRTNLQFKIQGPQKVIGLHSVQPAEGKSFNATNLASIMAMNDKKTILIGADMRKPRLHKIFNLANTKGLSNYLASQYSSKEIIQQTEIDNLSLIASGPIPPNPAELIERPAFSQLLEELKAQFDYIIIDNAPVSRVTDGLLTSRHCNLNIFILRYGVSKKNQLKFINDIAKQGEMNNPALIINDIKLNHFSYGYGHSYQYAYGKGYTV